MAYIRKGRPVDPKFFLDKVEFHHKRKDVFQLDGDSIKLHSDRYKCFKNSGLCCVTCGIEGKHFYKEKHRSETNEVYHLNLYAISKEGKEVLMTKDHRIPKSKGGKDHWSNYDTMCIECNSKKGNLENCTE
jgi:5-methylcytosine-specific restriction endonuclease McrA